MSDNDQSELLEITAEIVSSYVANNAVSADKLPELIGTVHSALCGLSNLESSRIDMPQAAVDISQSITPDYLICLEDGKKLKMLKRYLRSKYDMTPEEYRTKWRLPPDYPMVAPNYAKLRSKHAKDIGLGKKR